MDMSIINAGISSLLSAAGLVKGFSDVSDAVKLNTVKFDLTNHIIEAQGKLLEAGQILVEQNTAIEELRKRIAEMESDRAEKLRYRLVRLGGRGDFFAYELRPATDLKERQDEAPHFCCQSCFDAGKKVVLISNGEGYWHCPICKTATPGGGFIAITGARRGSITDGFF